MEGRNKELAGIAEKGSEVEEHFQECSKRKGEGLATSFETLGVIFWARPKQSRAQEKASRRKCDVRFSTVRKHFIIRI